MNSKIQTTKSTLVLNGLSPSESFHFSHDQKYKSDGHSL